MIQQPHQLRTINDDVILFFGASFSLFDVLTSPEILVFTQYYTLYSRATVSGLSEEGRTAPARL